MNSRDSKRDVNGFHSYFLSFGCWWCFHTIFLSERNWTFFFSPRYYYHHQHFVNLMWWIFRQGHRRGIFISATFIKFASQGKSIYILRKICRKLTHPSRANNSYLSWRKKNQQVNVAKFLSLLSLMSQHFCAHSTLIFTSSSCNSPAHCEQALKRRKTISGGCYFWGAAINANDFIHCKRK